MGKKNIIFVDDEENILSGLRRMLRGLHEEWEMVFVTTGSEALDMFEKTKFDVIISDMRMPNMDGSQLLTEVMNKYPDTVRIILSGHSDQEMILRSIGPAHQFLAKPCDAEIIKDTVLRSSALRDILNNNQIKDVIGQIKSLPSLPNLYFMIIQELSNPNASMKKISEIITSDIGMTAKLLQLVNSAFFGLGHSVTNISQAVSLLGVDIVKTIVLTVKAFGSFNTSECGQLSIEVLRDHCLGVASTARDIAKKENCEQRVVEDSFTAGMLHDIGIIILASKMPKEFDKAYSLAHDNNCMLWQAEKEVMGVNHAEVGAYLLGVWGLPNSIVESIAFHHEPSLCLNKGFSPLGAIHIADVLINRNIKVFKNIELSQFDNKYLEELGLTQKVVEIEKEYYLKMGIEIEEKTEETKEV